MPGRPYWQTVKVELRPQGHSYLVTLLGGKRYIKQIIAEFEEYRAQLDAGLEVSPDSQVGKG